MQVYRCGRNATKASGFKWCPRCTPTPRVVRVWHFDIGGFRDGVERYDRSFDVEAGGPNEAREAAYAQMVRDEWIEGSTRGEIV